MRYLGRLPSLSMDDEDVLSTFGWPKMEVLEEKNVRWGWAEYAATDGHNQHEDDKLVHYMSG